ncbi:MAG: ABC transporter ATP-binding protein [Clostridia bacterium]|nr:ABC transporter ATP-binding protein [Clostridia bacterium]MBR0227254.1 ABC transporter ATP-binding protein [Clostridia bacterium]
MSEYLLEAKNLSRVFPAAGKKTVQAVSDVSIGVREGETLGLVGESGCGKSTLGRLMIRLLKPTAGDVLFRGKNITAMGEKEFAPFRREMQLVFQDPYASLDPRMSVRDLIAEPIETWRLCENRQAVTGRVQELLHAVGVPEEFLYRYPHQFSGGQRQRIGIARAIAAEPSFIVCDEPVSALDVSVQNQILNLLKELKSSRKLTYLFISHDLSVVRYLSDRVCVMFLGKVCEIGPTEEVYNHPRHPYTRFLLDAVPQPDPRLRGKEIRLLRGDPPSPANPPSGCRFRTRCPFAKACCSEQEPPLRELDGVQAACHFAEELKSI